jgi:hypothetical protein
MNTNRISIPQLLRQLADLLENPENKEMTEMLSLMVRSLLDDLKTDNVKIEIRKGCLWKVFLNILGMIDSDWFVMRDKNGEELKKSGKVMKRKNVEINRKKVSEWFTEKFFGKKMSSWDQLMEYVFGNKSRKEILDAMDTPREMIRRRLDNEC